jgi:hypothetical protein
MMFGLNQLEMLTTPVKTVLLSMLLAVVMSAGADDTAQVSMDELETTRTASDLDALEGGVSNTSVDTSIRCDGKAVCRETSTKLPLRVLPRPFSHLYKAAEASKDGIAKANLPAFKPWYVFQRKDLDLSDPANPKGWYEVGQSMDKAQGWIKAADAFEWRQALLVSYTHPGDPGEGRHPVLMFSERKHIESLVESEDLADTAAAYFDELNAGKVPEGVVSMEPKRFVDISKQFYLLPILQFETVEIEGDEARLLQIAAAVPGSRGADTLENKDYADQAKADRGAGSQQLLEDIKVDVVFVIDTTGSMQPYIDMTREAVASMVKKIGGKLADKVRFGLIGYRDSLEVAPKLEYTAKNFTPELVDGSALVTLLTGAKAAKVGSKDYQEEVFAGINETLTANWRDNSLKFVVLIGDASSHIKGHPQNTTSKGAEDLLRDLNSAQVHVVAMHLADPRAAKDFPRAEAQFRTLSRVRGSDEESAYIDVNAFEKDDFLKAVDMITSRIGDRIEGVLSKAKAGQMSSVVPRQPVANGNGGVASNAGAAFDKAWTAALVEYLGQNARPPKDIVAWVLDRDLVDPSMRALDVRVLITRNQLSSLVQAMDRVIQALMQAEVTQEQFFQALQGVAGQTMKRPEDIGQSQKLVDTGLLPAFIESLPYKSDILSLSDEMYSSMTADDRAKLQWSLLAKLKQYREINEQVDAWQKLNDSDTQSDMVYPLNIDYLP